MLKNVPTKKSKTTALPAVGLPGATLELQAIFGSGAWAMHVEPVAVSQLLIGTWVTKSIDAVDAAT